MTAGNVDVNPVQGEKTTTGAQKQTFGSGSAAQSEAGKKGGAISGTFTIASVSQITLTFATALSICQTHAPNRYVVAS